MAGHQADFHLYLRDMNQLGVFLLLPNGMLIYHRNDPSVILMGVHFYIVYIVFVSRAHHSR